MVDDDEDASSTGDVSDENDNHRANDDASDVDDDDDDLHNLYEVMGDVSKGITDHNEQADADAGEPQN